MATSQHLQFINSKLLVSNSSRLIGLCYLMCTDCPEEDKEVDDKDFALQVCVGQFYLVTDC